MHYSKRMILALAVIGFYMTGCMPKENETKTEKEGKRFTERDQMQKAMQQEFMMTVDPALGYIPKERMVLALDYERRLQRQMREHAFTWAERGPNNISGRTRAVVIDSRDATGNTVITGSVSGGIWKTTNFKSATNPTWSNVNPNMGSLAICALAQDPLTKTNMYAGTGEGWFNSDAVRGNGIWKSTDGGDSWNKLTSTDSTAGGKYNFDYIQDIVVNGQGVVFASSRPSFFCNRGGVFRSADGGTTWTRVIGALKPGATTCADAYDFYGADLELSTNGDMYATTGYINSGTSDTANFGRVWRSASAGAGALGTWVDITPPGGVWQRIEIAVAPGNAAVIYALLEGQGDGIGAIKKSIDFGATWTDLPLPDWCNQGSPSSDFTNGQAFYDLIVQVDPNDQNKVIIGGIDLFKSTNGGAAWSQITQWARNCTFPPPSTTPLPVVHADHHNLTFFPGSSTELIDGNDGGIYYSNDGGTTWASFTTPNLNGANQTTVSRKNIGYNVTQLYACDIHPTNTNYFVVGSQDNGSFELKSAGLGDGIEASVGGDGGFCHIDQTDGNLQLLSYVYNNYYYSRNGGASFIRTSFNDNGFFINPSDLDDSKKVLYSGSIAARLGLVSNLSAGTPSFTNVTVSNLGIQKVSAVRVDPTVSGGGTVWVAGYDSTRAQAPAILKLTNVTTASATQAITNSLPVPAGAYVSSIDVDPGNANHILATLSNYGVASVFESTDGGLTFANIEGNLPDVPVRSGIILPANASVDGVVGGGILVATEVGVWFAQTTNGTFTSWVPQNTGLPNVRCDMLRYRPSDGLLAVATHGRGLFTTNLTLVATGIPSVPNTKNFIDYTTASQQQLFVKVGNLNTTSMELRLFSIDGRLVYSSKTRYANQTIPISQLARGSYILKIYGNKNEQFSKQFVK